MSRHGWTRSRACTYPVMPRVDCWCWWIKRPRFHFAQPSTRARHYFEALHSGRLRTIRAATHIALPMNVFSLPTCFVASKPPKWSGRIHDCARLIDLDHCERMRPTAKECIRVTGEVSDGLLDGYRSGAKSRRQINRQAYRSPVSRYFDRRRYSPCAVDSWVARSGGQLPLVEQRPAPEAGRCPPCGRCGPSRCG
jgi:hypothetical protein